MTMSTVARRGIEAGDFRIAHKGVVVRWSLK
jgi:hypothetical protein